jgi:hypothetical protein
MAAEKRSVYNGYLNCVKKWRLVGNRYRFRDEAIPKSIFSNDPRKGRYIPVQRLNNMRELAFQFLRKGVKTITVAILTCAECDIPIGKDR